MMSLVTPPPAIDRDRYGRPLVVPPNGGKNVPYTRATTYVGCIEDQFNLQKWMQRMVALGLASRPDLLLSVSAHRDDKRELDTICEKAREAAQASAAATTGTALHALTELVDRGEELPPLPPGPAASLAAYREATADLRPLHIERFMVLDTLRIGGTPDRIVKTGKGPKAQTVIADVKTGNIEYGIVKIAAQLAVYSRSWLYDITTGERTAPGVSTSAGLIVHLPAVEDPADARCDLVWVDLLAGWNDVLLARDIRESRRKKYPTLTRPWTGPQPPRFGEVEPEAPAEPDLGALIDACADADAIRALWAAHADAWDDALTERAKARIASFPAA